MVKAILALFTLLVCAIACAPVAQVDVPAANVEYWKNHAVKRIDTSKGEKEGAWISFFENGLPQESKSFSKGLCTSHVRWWLNGITESISYYINGEKHGIWMMWDATGTKVLEQNYVRDLLEGRQIEVNPPASTTIETNYSNGKLHGRYMKYKTDGKILELGAYEQGQKTGDWYEWDKEGTLVKKEHFP